MDLYSADRSLNLAGRVGPSARILLDRYPRDLRRALSLAESGQVGEGYAILLQGLLDAREVAHQLLQQVYEEAVAVYERRYTVAAN